MSEVAEISYLEKVRRYAETEATKGFVWVYRAEGEHDPQHASLGRTDLAGTWFTPSFELAESHARKLREKNISNIQIIAMAVPQSQLDSRDSIDAGMNEINVVYRRDATVRIVEAPIDEPPTADVYTSQFDLTTV